MDLRSGLPYWRMINRSHVCYPVLDSDLTCEIAVVGGGITGALAAYGLSQEGLDLVLLDQREIGSGSTAACTGFLQYAVDVELSDLIDTVGQEPAVRRYRLGTEAIETVRNLTSTLGDDFGFEDRTSLYLASKKSHVRKLRTKKLERRFTDLFPGRPLNVCAAWAVVFGDTEDGLAYIGPSTNHPQAYFALGHGGNGITFSVMASQIIADLYLGRSNPDADIFRFNR